MTGLAPGGALRDPDPLDLLAAWVRASRHERESCMYELERTPRWRIRQRSLLRARICRRESQEGRVLERFFGGCGRSDPGRRARLSSSADGIAALRPVERPDGTGARQRVTVPQ